MHPSWQQHLVRSGATIENGRVAHFGNPAAESLAGAAGNIITDLSHFGLIGIDGEDAQTFLQGQLTNDVRKLDGAVDGTSAQWTGYCSPKGRLLATLLLWKSADTYLLQLPMVLAEAIQKRLSMFVLRAKVKLTDLSEPWVRIGVAGPDAPRLLVPWFPSLPQQPMGVVRAAGNEVIRLQDNRFEIIVPHGQAPTMWDALAQSCTQTGASVWDWLMIHSGIPVITSAIQEQFVPQMVNFELIGGVSFQKGCYTGQEIVARSQYRGQVKRRMFLAHLETAAAPIAGDELFSAGLGDQSCGMLVNSAPAPGGGFDVLAVIHAEAANGGPIHWQRPDGLALQLLPLPYPLP